MRTVEFDSYIVKNTEEDNRGYRLLDVDRRIVVPLGVDIRCLVRREDVIHAFALPRCILKADAVPGRLNELAINISFPGVLYGQCSEICGANHRFMPIVLERIPSKAFCL